MAQSGLSKGGAKVILNNSPGELQTKLHNFVLLCLKTKLMTSFLIFSVSKKSRPFFVRSIFYKSPLRLSFLSVYESLCLVFFLEIKFLP